MRKEYLLLLAAIFALEPVMTLAAACPARGSIQETIGVDRTESITPKQLAAWLPVASTRVAALCPGDSLQIFTIDANTLSSKPLFHDALPPKVPDGAILKDRMLYKAAVVRFQKDAQAALELAFHKDGHPNVTDIFSLFERIPADPSRHREVLVFSDALQSASDLNLERVALKASSFPALMQKLADIHRWQPGSLRETDVLFVLPSPDTNGPPVGPNDARVLRDFYTVLVRSLGGQLQSFESYLGQGGQSDGTNQAIHYARK